MIVEDRVHRPQVTILSGQDFSVMAWATKTFGLFPMMINRAFGLVEDDQLVGVVAFRDWNGFNAEVCYYGKNVLTVGIVHLMVQFALTELGVERLTVKIPKNRKRLGKKVLALGGRVEGVLRHFYGREDGSKNEAIMYEVPKEALLRLAGPDFRRRRMN